MAEPDGIRVQVSLPSGLHALNFLGRVLEAFLEALERPQDALFSRRLDLALSEAVTNAVLHGNRGNPSAVLEVTFAYLREGNEVVMTVADGGMGFDPDAVPVPTTTLSEGGRGIFLIRSVMDQVTSDVGRGRHTLTMRRRLS